MKIHPTMILPLTVAVMILRPVEAAGGEYNWTRNFRIGASMTFNIEADFKLGGTFDVSSSNPGQPGQPGLDHYYDDGYVRVDDTGNAEGYTSFWGYENGAQYDPVSKLLTFQSTESFTASGEGAADDTFLGFDMAYGGKIKRWGRATLGWEFGFGLLPIELEETTPLTGNFSQITHRFDTKGIIMPDAPYHGPFASAGVPTIGDIASETRDTVSGTITGSRGLDVMLYSFRLGPTLHWQFSRRWGAMLSAGGAMGVVAGDYEYDETLQPQSGSAVRNRGSFDQSDVVYGAYAAGTILFRTHEPADIYLTAQYMGLGDSTFSEGGREAELRLGQGFSIVLGINWPF